MGKLALLAVLAAAAPAFAAKTVRDGSVAVLRTKMDAHSRRALPTLFDEYLMAVVQNAGELDVIGAADLEAMYGLHEQRELLGCTDTWCWAEISGAVGARQQVALKVVRITEARGWLVVSKVLEVEGQLEAIHSELVPGDGRALLEAVPRIVHGLIDRGRGIDIVQPSFFSRQATAPHRRGGECSEDSPETCSEECAAGVAASCQQLAAMYFTGRGVETVWGRSAIFYEQACDLGSASACNNLGVLHQFGFGVDADPGRARSLYALACDRGNGEGCTHLARLLQRDQLSRP